MLGLDLRSLNLGFALFGLSLGLAEDLACLSLSLGLSIGLVLLCLTLA